MQSNPAAAGKNSRFCPALNLHITPQECGQSRSSTISCTSDCAFNPFASRNYEQFLPFDAAIIPKMHQFLGPYLGKERSQKLADECQTDFDRESNLRHTLTYVLIHGLRIAVEEIGPDRLKSMGWKNDELVWMKAIMNSFPAVLEIQQMRPTGEIQCIDLLEPEHVPIVLMDRTMAREAVRFTRIVGWFTPFPHYLRPTASVTELPEDIWRSWFEALKEFHARARRKDRSLTHRQCLAQNYAHFLNLTMTIYEDWRKTILSQMDFHECTATYRITGDAQSVRAILEAKPELKGHDDLNDDPVHGTLLASYDWVREGESKEIEKDMPAAFRRSDSSDLPPGGLASVELFSERLTLKTFTQRKFAFAKSLLKKWLGDRVEMDSESIVDVAKQMAAKSGLPACGEDGDAPENSSAVPQTLSAPPDEVIKDLMQKMHRQHYERFLEDQIPMLDGMTPRQAAKSRKMRPTLIELMKGHLHHVEKENREKGTNFEIGWVLTELELNELL